MYSQDVRPKWWQVYLTFPLLVVLFAVDYRLKISSRGHQIVQIGIVVFVFGLVHLWLKANRSALLNINRSKYHGSATVIHILSFSDTNRDEYPILQFPDSEVKGVLSDTFEMDCINAESFPWNEVSQGSKKK